MSGVVNGKLYAIGGTNGSVSYDHNEVYTPGDLWLTKSDMPTAQAELAAAVVGGKLYALGGSLDGNPIATSHAYDPGTNRWTSRAPMTEARAGSNGAGVINGIVYVPGGRDASNVYRNSLFAYNPGTNTWSQKANMPVASGCGGSGVIGGHLYVYAVCLADGRFQPGLYVYNPATNSWGGRISAPFHRFPAVAVVNGKLYLAGGLTSGGSASSYDPATGQWTSLSPMSFERQSATAVGLNGLLYVMGGHAAFGDVGTVEVYDPGTRQW
ncbi:MAG: kelch repeat-containing protein, partial [Gemmatimonadales bacterium]